MKPRLIMLLGQNPPYLATIRGALSEVLERAELPAPVLAQVLLPEPLAAEGYAGLALEDELLGPESAALHLAPHLSALTRALLRAQKCDVLSVFVHLEKLEAEACFHPSAGFARKIEGDPFEVLRQAAVWMAAQPHALYPLFGASAPLQSEEPETPDEDDLYVRSRLESAREWLTRYRRPLL